MSYDKSVSDQYLHGSLLKTIEAALPDIGKSIDTVTIKDLAPIDEFHIGGPLATESLIEQLNFPKQSYLLDVGCGLGGAARYVASKYQHRVTGIDLTPEYIEAGNTLCQWLALNNDVCLNRGNALTMPYKNASFDGGYMLHVGMNIEDKLSLFTEIYRVLKPGATFGIYDVMREKDGKLMYPVPWATNIKTSKLSTPEQYKQALKRAGFEISQENNRRDFALDFFSQLQKREKSNQKSSPLGLHILMQENTTNKIRNMVNGIKNAIISPVEIIAMKK
jgi:ubiquinone/menaquinone biosynthesis C-methylase UbiE